METGQTAGSHDTDVQTRCVPDRSQTDFFKWEFVFAAGIIETKANKKDQM